MFLGFYEVTIAFESREEAFALLGAQDEFLRAIGEAFSCRVVSRGDGLSISGEEKEVRRVARLVSELLGLYRQGVPITPHEVRYGARLAREDRADELHAIFNDTILVTEKGKSVRARTTGQRAYLAAIQRHAVTLGIGPAGTGKTYLAVVMAARALRTREVSRIILTRPAVEAGERLGFLPGDMQEKVDPYLRPLYDALQDIFGVETYQKLLAKGIIEIAPLAYMRGRTLESAFIILDEAQNTTSRQMKMFLTRLGVGSKMVVTGDLSQIDLPCGAVSGLAEAKEALADVKDVATAELTADDIVRHDTVTRIVRAYESYEAKKREEQQGENHFGNHHHN